MTFSVTMPALGESVSEGTVTRWLKAEGDHVNVDEPLLEVSTDKVDTEIPSPVAGILTKIVVGIDQTVAVGAELAIIADSAGASTPAPAAPVAAPTPPPVAVAPVVAPTPPPAAPVAAPAASGSGTVITMPALGESVSEGTVTRWLKNIGDSVAVDEALLEVSTDKVDTEIPSPVAGTLLAIDVAVDTTVPVGARLGLIGGANAPVATAITLSPHSFAQLMSAGVSPITIPISMDFREFLAFEITSTRIFAFCEAQNRFVSSKYSSKPVDESLALAPSKQFPVPINCLQDVLLLTKSKTSTIPGKTSGGEAVNT